MKQEYLLGIGGILLLKKLGIKKDVYHLNEGHAALINALMVFTMRATCEGSLVNWLKRLAVSMKKGAPGG